MFSLSVVTIPSVALRYRCGRAFSHSPTLVQVDAATMARLQADSALTVQVVEAVPPPALSVATLPTDTLFPPSIRDVQDTATVQASLKAQGQKRATAKTSRKAR